MQKLLQSRKPSYWWTLAGVLALSVLTYGGQDIHTSMATWPALMHAFGAWLSNPFAIVSVLASVWGVSFNPRTEAVTQTAWGVSVRGTDSDTTAPSKPAAEPTVTTTDPQEVTDDDDTGD
ncbi:hypothetical protein [Lacticaseibacillus songhuajiangensis]|jgi:hypothetical protein|uniref:hypothetical protein n=1 Tax=Lacticaseibacillus songhuajiangensis TaxID=1296539 RepID=UPI000F76AB26|nr:hypothetical protein [Lacticaseibacillus songhuajiangensis]